MGGEVLLGSGVRIFLAFVTSPTALLYGEWQGKSIKYERGIKWRNGMWCYASQWGYLLIHHTLLIHYAYNFLEQSTPNFPLPIFPHYFPHPLCFSCQTFIIDSYILHAKIPPKRITTRYFLSLTLITSRTLSKPFTHDLHLQLQKYLRRIAAALQGILLWQDRYGSPAPFFSSQTQEVQRSGILRLIRG